MELYKMEPESYANIHPPASFSEDPLIDVKEEELLIPTCPLERKDEVSDINLGLFFHSYIKAFVEIFQFFYTVIVLRSSFSQTVTGASGIYVSIYQCT
jgi:hypothetical protein